MAPSPLMLAEFPPAVGLEKISGCYSPTRSRSLASNTTSLSQGGSAQDDISENESWGQWSASGGGDIDYGHDLQSFDAVRGRTMPVRLENEHNAFDQSPRRKGLHRKSGGSNFCPESPQRLPAHITRVLDAAVAELEASDAHHTAAISDVSHLEAAPPGLEAPPSLRPPPGLEAPPGLEEFVALQNAKLPAPTRYQTPPPPERPPPSILASPYRSPALQHESPFQSPFQQQQSMPSYQSPSRLASPWSPHDNQCAAAWPTHGPPVQAPPMGGSPTFLSTMPLSPQFAAPPQPPMWDASVGLVSPVPPKPDTWGPISPVPAQPPTWGGLSAPPPLMQPASWGAVPTCPPPQWTPRCHEEDSSPPTAWIKEDLSEAMSGSCRKPLKVFMDKVECEVPALDRCQPARKPVPEWL